MPFDISKSTVLKVPKLRGCDMGGEAAKSSARRRAPAKLPERRVGAPKPSTKALLIEAGERLFARHGFDGISLREIASAAGQSNCNAVQYHFGNKAGFIGAILDDRMQKSEAKRAAMLAELEPGEERDPRTLLNLLWLPLMSVRGTDGRYTFCQFLLQHMLQSDIARQPLTRLRDGEIMPDESATSGLPSLVRTTDLLRNHYRDLPAETYRLRLTALSMMLLASIVEFDNLREPGSRNARAEYDINPILDMAVAALPTRG
jgi:AcrR family transcriptional regulator